MSTTERALLFAGSLATALGACQADPPSGSEREPALPDVPVVHEIEYATVAISEGNPHRICGGTLARIDRHVATVSGILDIEPEPIEIYWYEPSPNSGRPAAYFDEGAIVTTNDALLHELGHAITIPVLGRSDTLFLEGIANAFGKRTGTITRQGSTLPSENLGKGIRGSGHFSRWLVDAYGPEPFKTLFDRPEPSTEELFERLADGYGAPLEDLEAEYAATAPAWYPEPGRCDGLERMPWPEGRETFRYDTVADCSSTSAFGHTGYDDTPYAMSFVLEVPPALVGRRFTAPVVLPDSAGNLGTLMPCDIGEGPPGMLAEPKLFDSAVSPHLVGEFQDTAYRVELPFREDGEVVALEIELQGR